ncbi:alpha-mannosidase 2-like [Cydia amplana]|uniref:alpha-mannosidase 2-like n=1 Tax=Cydia amplana TaxID=1869771 RepID=UPI002FE55033
MCHEKTLRKIVRNQSKMVQRPFYDKSGMSATGMAGHSYLNPLNIHRASSSRTVPARSQHLRRVPLVPSAVNITRGKIFSRMKTSQAENLQTIELRSARNIFLNSSKIMPQIFDLYSLESNKNSGNDSTWENIKGIPRKPSPFFPAVDDNHLQTIEAHPQPPHPQAKETIVIPIPESQGKYETDDPLLVKGIFRAKAPTSIKPNVNIEPNVNRQSLLDYDSQKLDYFMEVPMNLPSNDGHNMSIEGFHICASIESIRSNIDAQKRFTEFDIEPSWMRKRNFWNNIYNSRYEFLMRNSKWPPLKVILVPRSHVNTIWKNTFEHYNNNSANKIISNIVKKMNLYPNLTFNWNEISHLSKWWKTTTHKNRASLRKFVTAGRLEITTGGWVESDEGTTHIFGLVHNLIEGHQWLAEHLNYAPDVGWLTNSVTHSPTLAYLLSASGITKLIFTNVHYSWEEYFAEYQISDFVWVQNWINEGSYSSELNKLLKQIGQDRYPSNSVLSHYLQFNTDGFGACGPNKQLCTTDFDFFKHAQSWHIHGYNVKEKSELILEQYSKTGTLTPHNVIIAPIGGPHHFANQEEIDYQYNNYEKIAEFINVNRNIYKATIEFGTPMDYFKSILKRNLKYPSLKGDFLNFADVENGIPAYWTGYFTSRPLLKILLRRLQATLRSSEILFSFAIADSTNDSQDIDVNIIELLTKSRETVARLLDRNVIGGTLSSNVLRYVHESIWTTVNDCWKIQEAMVSLFTTNKTRKNPYLSKYVYRDGEFISVFRTISPGDNVLVFNSLSHERYEIIELFTKIPNIRIVDHNKKDVAVQVNPVWKYDLNNVVVISKQFFKIMFAVLIPPLTIELFKVKESSMQPLNTATIYCVHCIVEEDMISGLYFPFTIQPIEHGDVQLESYKHRLVFDENTGFLKTVVEKDTYTEKPVVINYGAFTGSYVNSGMFLLNTNTTKPIRDILKPYRTTKIFMILTGQLITEFTSVYGQLLHHTVKLFNVLNSPLSSAILIESKVDLDISPNNRDVELFMSVQTDIYNGNPPEIYIDNNGFQYTPRTINVTRRIESNVYPITTLSYIQDRKQRLTVITDHAQGVTAMQEGQIVVMLDRRVLFDDGRGVNEGLADRGATYQRHYILLENFSQTSKYYPVPHLKSVQLPSFKANYLSNTFNYDIDIFIIDKNVTGYCLYAIIPLIKATYPCDVFLLSYRTFLDGMTSKRSSKNVGLMILHRQSFTCQINYESLVHCDVDPNLSIQNILPSARTVFKTNLAGTNEGTRLKYINLEMFQPMELLTLRIHS